jgi:hypothetical protein
MATIVDPPRLPVQNSGWILLRGDLTLLLGIAAAVFPLRDIFEFTLLFAAYAFSLARCPPLPIFYALRDLRGDRLPC